MTFISIDFVTENTLEDLPPDWWGYKYGFVSGGFLGAESRRRLKSENTQKCNERTVFFEADQENLYKLVQVSTLLKSDMKN